MRKWVSTILALVLYSGVAMADPFYSGLVTSGGEWPRANGTYVSAGMAGGKPSYVLRASTGEVTHWLWWTGFYWNLIDDNEQRFTHMADTPAPPPTGWRVMPSNAMSALKVADALEERVQALEDSDPVPGPKGDPGPQGPAGPKGLQGVPGATGP